MYKQVFQNSKVALLFAGMTLFSAVSMVGTPEDSGLLTKTVDLVESQRGAFAGGSQGSAEGQSVSDQTSGDGAVFGEFNDEAEPATAGPTAKAKARQGSGPMDAPMSSTAIVAERGNSTGSAVPFISDGEMTIEPE